MIKLSIIVPIYGVEQYLHKCVDSLLAQDLASSEYEIILVDDESPDACPQICDEYARMSQESRVKSQELPCIRVIHRKNGGLSAARNTGIKVAKGEYICFVDSDDYWEYNVLGGLMEQVERENLDVLRFNYQNVRLKADPQQCSTDGHRLSDRAKLFTRKGKGEDASKMISGEYEVFQPYKHPHQVDERCDVQNGETYLEERMGYACYAWQFVIKREIVGVFVSGIHFEDTEWMPRMMLKAKRVNSTPTIVYNYLWREGSITLTQGNIEKIRKNIESLIQVNISLQHLLFRAKYKRWLYGCVADNVYCILNNVAAYDFCSVSYWINIIKQHGMLPLHGYKVRMIIKLRYLIINLSPKLYCWLRHIRLKYGKNEVK